MSPASIKAPYYGVGKIISALLIVLLLLLPTTTFAATTSGFHCWAFGWVLQFFGQCTEAVEPPLPQVIAPEEIPNSLITGGTPSVIGPVSVQPIYVDPPEPGSGPSINQYITNQLTGGVTEAELNQRVFDLIGYINVRTGGTQLSPDTFSKLVTRLSAVEKRRIISNNVRSIDNLTDTTLRGDILLPELTTGALTYVDSSGNLTSAVSLVYESNSLLIGTTTAREALTVSGAIYIASSTPNNTTNSLYNVAGTLYWNGDPVGTGGATSTLNGLTDVVISGATPGNLLSFNGTNWVNVATSSLGITGASSAFANSSELASLLSDETGTGVAVFNTSPIFAGTALFNALTASSTLSLSGSAANIALGANYLSGDGGDEGIFVDGSGNVGIGTTTPGGKLVINAALNGSSYGLNIDTTARVSGEAYVYFGDSDKADLLINTNGNIGVGISTTTPSYRLDLSNAGSNGNVRFQATSQTQPDILTLENVGNGALNRGVGVLFNVPVAGVGSVNGARIYIGEELNNGTSYISFQTGIAGTLSENLRLSSAGNLGLGTTSPSARLTVAGDMRLTGRFADASSSTGSVGQLLMATATGTQWVSTSTLGLVASSSFSNSFGLASILSDETGTGAVIFNTSPTFAGTALFNALTASSTLTLSGSLANIALGSNYVSSDGDDEGIFIDATGRVGVGTASLSNTFTVSGTTNISGNTTVGSLIVSGNARLNSGLLDSTFATGTPGQVLLSTGSATRWTSTSTLGFGSILTNNITLGSYYLSGDGDNEGIYVDSAGRVGIGTSTPGVTLSVNGTGRYSGQLEVGSLIINANARLSGGLFDGAGATGTPGQILSTIGSQTRWISTSTLGLSTAFTNSSQLAGLLTDETGTGFLVFNTNPSFAGLISSSTLTLSGTAANIALGSNYLSGDGDDEGILVDASGRVGIGTTTTNKIFTVGGIVTPGVASVLMHFNSTGTVSNQIGMEVLLDAGHTGTGVTTAISARNIVAGIRANIVGGDGNIAIQGASTASTTGYNFGAYTQASGGSVNIGNIGKALVAKSSGTNIGMAGFGYNTAMDGQQIGGYFGLGNTDPVLSSSALIANNGSVAAAIFSAQDNGSTTFIIADGGNVGIGTTSPTALLSLAIGGAPYNQSGFLIASSSNILLDLSGEGKLGLGMRPVAANSANFTIQDGNPYDTDNFINLVNTWGGSDFSTRINFSFTDRTAVISAYKPSGVALGTDFIFRLSDTVDNTEQERMRLTGAGNLGIGTSSPTANLSVVGTVRFANLTGGDLSTDSQGNLSVSSDERLKDIEGTFGAGLAEILQLQPIVYRWNEESGMETTDINAGFSAQNVLAAIPEAVGQGSNGFLTLTIRPIVAALVNSVKELYTMVTQHTTDIEQLRTENEALRQRIENLEQDKNIDNTDVSPVLQSPQNAPGSPDESVETPAPSSENNDSTDTPIEAPVEAGEQSGLSEDAEVAP